MYLKQNQCFNQLNHNTMKNQIIPFLLGVIITGLTLSFITTNNYGRMSEHLGCDRNIEVQNLEEASERYYESHK
jgi:hypothetical protein